MRWLRAAARAGKGRGIHWQRRQTALLLGVATLASGLSILAYATHLLRRPELQSVDARFSIRGAEPRRTAAIVVVRVDSQTFNDFRNRGQPAQWPFPRRYHARVINQLHRAGAKLIAFDVQFTEPTDPADDNALIEAVGRAGNMVLATTEVGKGGSAGVLGGDAVLRELGAHAGNSSLVLDPDGVARNMQYSIAGLRSFPVAIAEAATARAVKPSLFGGLRHPVPIDYAGPPGTVRSVSYSRVFAGQFAPATFSGKIVIVGASDPTLGDVHEASTSGSSPMTGAEVVANATATVLSGIPLRPVPGWINIALIAVLGTAAPLASTRVAPLRSLAGALALGLFFTIAVQLAFAGGHIVAFTYPLGALVIAALGTLAVIYLGELFERQRVRVMFARFVPGEVVDEVLARTDENLRLGSVQRDCTVLFCDLRGFTSFSETRPAEHVIEVVNFYLDEMTEAILDAGGTLISYMGDGLMALFGAPLEQPDHADRALVAAREMLGVRLPRLNEWLREQGDAQPFRMGVGIHSGPVMAGNVGSEQRLQYTVIGDTTNTASRLEAMTKDSGHQLFVSDSTRAMLTRPCPGLAFVSELDVAGRRGKVAVWSLLDGSAAAQGAPPEA